MYALEKNMCGVRSAIPHAFVNLPNPGKSAYTFERTHISWAGDHTYTHSTQSTFHSPSCTCDAFPLYANSYVVRCFNENQKIIKTETRTHSFGQKTPTFRTTSEILNATIKVQYKFGKLDGPYKSMADRICRSKLTINIYFPNKVFTILGQQLNLHNLCKHTSDVNIILSIMWHCPNGFEFPVSWSICIQFAQLIKTTFCIGYWPQLYESFNLCYTFNPSILNYLIEYGAGWTCW